ncbi:MAG: alpha/beta fold hydrolase, partial [Gammaproteobacteria bacterium]
MPRARANGIEIEYDSFGDPKAPAILLIMGSFGQLVLWPESFCHALADAGYYVIRYDNRDVGLSSKIEHAGKVRLFRAGMLATLRLPVSAPYNLDDMTQDALGLLDALKLHDAHVVGVSMGGMIGQMLAAKHGPRVKSFVSIMSHSGNPRLPGPRLEVRLRLIKRPTRLDRESLIHYGMQTWRLIGSPGYPVEEAALRAKVEGSFDRSNYPRGYARQLLAVLASGSRVPILRKISAPTLIIHGADDPLVPVAAAHDLQKHIPHARLEIVDGMGHDLPPQLLPRLTDLILGHVGA